MLGTAPGMTEKGDFLSFNSPSSAADFDQEELGLIGARKGETTAFQEIEPVIEPVMGEMAADEQQAGAVLFLPDEMILPDLLEHGARTRHRHGSLGL